MKELVELIGGLSTLLVTLGFLIVLFKVAVLVDALAERVRGYKLPKEVKEGDVAENP